MLTGKTYYSWYYINDDSRESGEAQSETAFVKRVTKKELFLKRDREKAEGG